jgi:hypothetical protein
VRAAQGRGLSRLRPGAAGVCRRRPTDDHHLALRTAAAGEALFREFSVLRGV